MASTVVIEAPLDKNVENFYCKICHKVKDNKSVVSSYNKSVATFHKCGKKGHLKSNYKSNINVSYWGLSEKSARKLQKLVAKKAMISDVEYLTTATMNRNKK